MNEKKKNQQYSGRISFILFWIFVVGLLQFQLFDYSDIARAIYDFIMQRLPDILHRLWVAYALHGAIVGLAIGLAQKFALQSLRPLRLKYWLPATVSAVIAVKALDYSVARFLAPSFINGYPVELYFTMPFVSQIILFIVPWLLLRKQFKQSWLLLAAAVPSFIITAYTSLSFYTYASFIQPLIVACVLVWLNQQTPLVEKFKHAAVSKHLDDSADEDLFDEEDEIEIEDEAPLAISQKRV